MLSSSDFKDGKVYPRISKGEVTLSCEWCGQELVGDEVADAETVLRQVREHNLSCPCNPRVAGGGQGADDKEIAKSVLGWCCEWCGDDQVAKNIMGSAKKLKAARAHALACACNPGSGQKG